CCVLQSSHLRPILHPIPARRSTDLGGQRRPLVSLRRREVHPRVGCFVQTATRMEPVQVWVGRDRGWPLVVERQVVAQHLGARREDRKSTRLNSSHVKTSYAVFCLKK